MPMYEYRCPECHRAFESLIRNARDEQELTCPHCQAPRPERTLSLPGKPLSMAAGRPAGNACGEGPPCGAPWCGRNG